MHTRVVQTMQDALKAHSCRLFGNLYFFSTMSDPTKEKKLVVANAPTPYGIQQRPEPQVCPKLVLCFSGFQSGGLKFVNLGQGCLTNSTPPG